MSESNRTRTPPAPTRLALPLLSAALACLLALQLGALSLLPASADDEADKAEAEEESDQPVKPGDRVFTNEDLRRYRSRVKASVPSTLVVDMTAPRPGAEPAPEAMDPDVKQRRVGAIQEEIRQDEERLRALDDRTRSLHNPFLPRPKLSEEEKQSEAGLDSRQILDMVNAERATLQARMTELRAELQSLARAPAASASAEPRSEAPPATETAQSEAPAPEPPRP